MVVVVSQEARTMIGIRVARVVSMVEGKVVEDRVTEDVLVKATEVAATEAMLWDCNSFLKTNFRLCHKEVLKMSYSVSMRMRPSFSTPSKRATIAKILS
jgi:hypothetical protein